MADFDAIRQRHAKSERDIDTGNWIEPDGIEAHVDRGILLAEVDRMRAALVAIVQDEVEWDIRIHRSAKARTTLRALLGEVRADA